MTKRSITAITTLVLASGAAFAQHEHEDYLIGVTSGGMLAAEGPFDEVHQLPEFNDSGINGWFGGEPGFGALDEDEPDEDFYRLDHGADIWFELVSADPAFKVYDHLFNLIAPGEEFQLGGDHFHTHAFWHIDSDDPAFDPNQEVWSVSWRVLDLGTTGYADSEVYTGQFTNIPAPGVLSLAAAGLLGMASRRRR